MVARIARYSFVLGVLVSLGAIGWWAHAYGNATDNSLAQFAHVGLSDFKNCLLSQSDTRCAVANYRPWVLYLGLFLIADGIVLALAGAGNKR